MSTTFKRTKILATIGPVTNSPEMIEKLAIAGVNGFRLNFSHGTYEEHEQQIEWVRQISEKLGQPFAVLQDLQGPKIRLGIIKDNRLEVKKGDELVLDNAIAEHDGSFNLPVQYNLALRVKMGQPVYIFDGTIKTTVIEVPSATSIKVRVENDGVLMSRKGLNLPDTDFSGAVITPKDIDDAKYGATKDIDYVALSFVNSADDINSLRQLLESNSSTAKVIAKIETKIAIREENLEKIVIASDGVMVARGDMAVEVGPEVVPVIERRIISLCRKYGKLCIVATQMMASMVENPEPTRAEVNDVATAVLLGADVVMLSDETANGKYPVETVAAMQKTIVYAQDHESVSPIFDKNDEDNLQRDAISGAAVYLSKKLGVDAIVAETKSGATAMSIANYRPNVPVLSVTSVPRVAQQLALRYANRSYLREDGESAGLSLANEIKLAGQFDHNPATVIIVSGKQPGLVGATDTIKVRVLE
jgi:pyruvate kinase